MTFAIICEVTNFCDTIIWAIQTTIDVHIFDQTYDIWDMYLPAHFIVVDKPRGTFLCPPNSFQANRGESDRNMIGIAVNGNVKKLTLKERGRKLILRQLFYKRQ